MSSSQGRSSQPSIQLALSCFEELLDCVVADVASECHRIARLGLDRSVNDDEEELRVWAARPLEVTTSPPPPRRRRGRRGGREQGRGRRVRLDAPRHRRRCRRVYGLRSPCRRRLLRPSPREVHGQGCFQKGVWI